MGKKKGVLSYEIGNEETVRVTERERGRGGAGLIVVQEPDHLAPFLQTRSGPGLLV